VTPATRYRLVSTSAGLAVTDYAPNSSFGPGFALWAFDSEGWQRGDRKTWSFLGLRFSDMESPPKVSPVKFVSESLAIHEDEASALLAEIGFPVDQYRQKSSRAKLNRIAYSLGLTLVLLSAFWGVLLTGWLIVHALVG
jgi:hypothetical protein